MYQTMTTKTIENTTKETRMFDDTNCIGTRTIPANFLQAGMTIGIRVRNELSNVGNPTNTMKIYLGSTEIYNNSATLGAVHSNDFAEIHLEITIRSVGATGTLVAMGRTLILGNSDVSRKIIVSTPITIDTTVENKIEIFYTWGTANASNILKTVIAEIDIYNNK